MNGDGPGRPFAGRAIPQSWGDARPTGDRPLTILELIRARTLDAELAGLLWLLIEHRTPIVVAARAGGTGKSTLLEALFAFLAPGTRIQRLAGVFEDFRWLPEAPELGWEPEWASGAPLRERLAGGAGETVAQADPAPATPADTYLMAAELSDHLPIYTWDDHARVAVRALSRGYGMGATIHADSLEEVLGELGSWPVRLSDDELSQLGVVLVVRRVAGGARRVVAAHYMRPVARDAGGHVQRLGPAVLATWDPIKDRLDQFWWGIAPELAERIGRGPGEVEVEQSQRTSYLTNLVDDGLSTPDELAGAIDAFRENRPRGIRS